MGTLAQSYFMQRIEECRASFDKGSIGFLRWIGMRIRPSYDGLDRATQELRSHYQILMRKGHIVWGCTAQVNMGMFLDGKEDLPGVTVYSLDPHYDANPQDLWAVGRACFQFKNTDPVDQDFKGIAARLTDEYDASVRMQVPKRLSDNREVYMGATMFHRRRLPEGLLRSNLVPLVVAPEATEVNMVLQLPYWSESLQKTWGTLQNTLEGCVINSSALQVSQAASKGPVKPRVPDWDVMKTPVHVTPAMVEAFHKQVNEFAKNVDFEIHPALLVCNHKEGPFKGQKRADVLIMGDITKRRVFKSNGIPVALDVDQVEEFRGSIVDYVKSLFDEGIILRLPGE